MTDAPTNLVQQIGLVCQKNKLIAMSAPIIFCHYSNSKYLPYVLEAARITNPDKNIVFLGDSYNQWLKNAKNIQHYYFFKKTDIDI